MQQKDKDLLLHDLCGRLPYNCIVNVAEGGINGIQWIDATLNSYLLYQIIEEDAWEYVKPYLRPLSSMTKEEKRELQSFFPGSFGNQWLDLEDGYIDIHECESTTRLYLYDATGLTEWLNKKMFDFRGLIPIGLALSTDEFNPYVED